MGTLYYFSFMLVILLVRLDFCKLSAAVDYIIEIKYECHYVNGTQHVRYLERHFYNQEEFMYFDSDVGEFIAKTELGRPQAESWNKNKEIIEDAKNAVETFCKHNYGVLHSVTADRRVQPEVIVSLMPHDDPSAMQHILICNVFGFYPSEVEVKWYRNGQEETEQVQSSELLQNGDWTFHILVMLETVIEKGDTFTCEVHHNSLETSHRVDWKPQISDAEKNKKATGIVGFVLGTVFIIAGIGFYMKGRKDQALFRGQQNQSFLPVS